MLCCSSCISFSFPRAEILCRVRPPDFRAFCHSSIPQFSYSPSPLLLLIITRSVSPALTKHSLVSPIFSCICVLALIRSRHTSMLAVLQGDTSALVSADRAVIIGKRLLPLCHNQSRLPFVSQDRQYTQGFMRCTLYS